jgi:hypothetical protein
MPAEDLVKAMELTADLRQALQIGIEWMEKGKALEAENLRLKAKVERIVTANEYVVARADRIEAENLRLREINANLSKEGEFVVKSSTMRELREDHERLDALSNLIEEDPKREIMIARRRDGLVYISNSNGDSLGGKSLDEACDRLLKPQAGRPK